MSVENSPNIRGIERVPLACKILEAGPMKLQAHQPDALSHTKTVDARVTVTPADVIAHIAETGGIKTYVKLCMDLSANRFPANLPSEAVQSPLLAVEQSLVRSMLTMIDESVTRDATEIIQQRAKSTAPVHPSLISPAMVNELVLRRTSYTKAKTLIREWAFDTKVDIPESATDAKGIRLNWLKETLLTHPILNAGDLFFTHPEKPDPTDQSHILLDQIEAFLGTRGMSPENAYVAFTHRMTDSDDPKELARYLDTHAKTNDDRRKLLFGYIFSMESYVRTQKSMTINRTFCAGIDVIDRFLEYSAATRQNEFTSVHRSVATIADTYSARFPDHISGIFSDSLEVRAAATHAFHARVYDAYATQSALEYALRYAPATNALYTSAYAPSPTKPSTASVYTIPAFRDISDTVKESIKTYKLPAPYSTLQQEFMSKLIRNHWYLHEKMTEEIRMVLQVDRWIEDLFQPIEQLPETTCDSSVSQGGYMQTYIEYLNSEAEKIQPETGDTRHLRHLMIPVYAWIDKSSQINVLNNPRRGFIKELFESYPKLIAILKLDAWSPQYVHPFDNQTVSNEIESHVFVG